MRATTAIMFCGVAMLLVSVIGGFYVWSTNRTPGAPSEAQWQGLKLYQTTIATADAVACPRNMLPGPMRLGVAEEKFSRFKARFTLSPAEAAELDRLAIAARTVAAGAANTETCTRTWQLLENIIGDMDRE